MIKIIHYRRKCIGCGICFELQPELWRLSRKDGKANLLEATEKKGIYLASSTAPQHLSLLIAKTCPGKAIKVVL